MTEPGAPFDPKALANLLLDVAVEEEREVSNLALQKLLYFAHARYLVETKTPLVKGYFEAWRFGPVHPSVYQAFKSAGDRPLDFRATSQDVVTGERRPIPLPASRSLRRRLEDVMRSYGKLTPGRLVELSHARNSPWDFIVNKASESVAFGMRIPDDVILERFKHHKVALGAQPRHGEPGEDTPFA